MSWTPESRVRPAVAFLLLALAPLAHAVDLDVKVTDAAGQPLADAVVYVVPATSVALPPPKPGAIDQAGKQFVPTVSAVQVGSTVRFPNSDNIRHQVYSFSPAKVFSLKLYSGRSADPVLFDKPGLVVLGCNIHDQMIAWLLVVPTPWFATTKAEGQVRLQGLPAGDYQLFAWHPGLPGEPPARRVVLGKDARHSERVTLPAGPVPRPGGRSG